MQDFAHIRALAFDVGGSVFDWKSAAIGQVRALAAARGVEIDAEAFALAWRMRMFRLLADVRSGARPRANADELHRQALLDIGADHAQLALTDDDRDALVELWHHLDVWPDFPDALARLRRRRHAVVLSVLSWSILVDSSRHCGLHWDGILSCEFLPCYKPDPGAYLACASLLRMQPREVMMVAVHPADLAAAQRAGLATAFVQPKPGSDEPGNRGQTDSFDIRAADYPHLAEQLGC